MASTYSNARFRRKLSSLNPRLRFVFGPDVASGIYLVDDTNDRGLRHVGAFPSPKYYPTVPQKDFRDDQKINQNGEPTFVRGWNSIVRSLVKKRVFGRGAAKRIFSDLK